MSAADSTTVQRIQQSEQDLQNDLICVNQLSRLISLELQQIIHLTQPGGEFEENVKKNAELMKKLAAEQQIDLDNLPPVARNQMNMSPQ